MVCISKSHQNSKLILNNQIIATDENTVGLWHFDRNLISSRGIKADPISLVTYHSDGKFNGSVAVEDATTNYVSEPTNPDSGWGSRVHTTLDVLPHGDGINMVPLNCKGYKMDYTTNASTWSGNAYSYSNIRSHPCTAGNKYTASVYCYVSADFNGTWAHISNEGVGSGASGYDFAKKGTWQKLTITFTASSTGNSHSYLYWCKDSVTDFSTLTGYIVFVAPQFEEKEFPTSFVNGSRATGSLVILNPITIENFTVSFWCKIIPAVGTLIPYATIFSMGNYYTNNSFTIMDSTGTSVSGYQTLIRRGNAGEWGWANGSFTNETNFRNWNMYTIVKNSTHYVLYSNGEYIGTIDHLSAGMQSYIYLGSRDGSSLIANSLFDELRIDKIARTAEEIKSWYLSKAPFYDSYDTSSLSY